MSENDEILELEPIQAQLTHPSPRGFRPGQVDGVHMAQIGAILGAMGMEQAEVTALFREFQAATVSALLNVQPTILKKLAGLNRAALNRVAQEISALPQIMPQPVGIMARLAGPQQPVPAYLDRDAVLRVLAMAIERIPAVN